MKDTTDGGHQQRGELRGDPAVDRTTGADTRDPDRDRPALRERGEEVEPQVKESETRVVDSQYDPPSARPLATAAGNKPLPTAVWEGTFVIGGVVLHCSVLDNGMRVIDAGDLQRFFAAQENGAPASDPEELKRFGLWRIE